MLNRFFKALVITLISNALIAASMVSTAQAYLRALPPESFNAMYALAAKGDIVSLDAAVKRGLNINSVNADGDTGLCVAVKRHDARAYNTFRAAGAAGRPPCSHFISDWDAFTNSSRVKSGALWQNSNSVKRGSDKFAVWPWVIGAGAVGVIALLLSGGGGGGSSNDEQPVPDKPVENPCDKDPCSAGCYVNLSCDEGYICAEENICGGCIRCEQKPATCADNPCMEGCYENIVCETGYSCSSQNSCGGCEACTKDVEPTPDFVIESSEAVENNQALSNTGTERTGLWGGIYAKNTAVVNNGDITLSGGKNGIGIMSCAGKSSGCMTGQTMQLSDKIVNDGNITIGADESIGIFSSSLKNAGGELDNPSANLENNGKITINGRDGYGIYVNGLGVVANNGLITFNSSVKNGLYGIFMNNPTYYEGSEFYRPWIYHNAGGEISLEFTTEEDGFTVAGIYLDNTGRDQAVVFNDGRILSSGLINVTQVYGYAAGEIAGIMAKYADVGVSGKVSVASSGGANHVYGVFSEHGDAAVSGTGSVSVKATDGSTAYGIYDPYGYVNIGQDENMLGQVEVIADGSSYSPGAAYGAYGDSVSHSGGIVVKTNYGTATGVYASRFMGDYYATIEASSTYGTVYGVRLDGIAPSEFESFSKLISASSVYGESYGVYLNNFGPIEGSTTGGFRNATNGNISAEGKSAVGLYAMTKLHAANSRSILNEGNITVHGREKVYGVEFTQSSDSATDHVTVENSGNISVVSGPVVLDPAEKINVDIVGVELKGRNFSMTNDGTIDVKQKMTLRNGEDSIQAYGMRLIRLEDGENPSTPEKNNGKVINNGEITVTTQSSDATGVSVGENVIFASQGNINVTGSGAGNFYGVKLNETESADNAPSIIFNEQSKIAVNMQDSGNAYGIYNEKGFIGDSSSETLKNVAGVLSVTGNTVGNLYGIYNNFGDISNAAAITVQDGNTGKSSVVSYGIYHDGQGDVINTDEGVISVTSYDATGIYAKDSGNVENNGTINVNARHEATGLNLVGAQSVSSGKIEVQLTPEETSSAGKAIGVNVADRSVFYNKGEIKVTATKGTAIGVNVKDASFTNEAQGAIDVVAGTTADDDSIGVGIYADSARIINEGTLTIKAPANQAYGIYAKNGSTIENKKTILITTMTADDRENTSGCEPGKCDGSATVTEGDRSYIYIDSTSTFINAADMVSETALDFDSYEGTMVAAKGAKFKAPSVSGRLKVATDTVVAGFDNQYHMKNVFEAEKVDVAAYSGSAMFAADSNGNDIVLNRRPFDELSSDSSISSYLERNYADRNNENLFRNLKESSDDYAYQKAEAQLLGYQLLPNFSQENMTVMRNLNAVLRDELLDNEEKERKIVGYDYQRNGRDTRHTLTGYENYANSTYFMYDNEYENMIRTGFGMAITQIRSDYDDDSVRKEIMAQVLVPVSYNNADNFKFASLVRAGYGDGDYKRRTDYGTYEADLSSWIYGINNTVGYEFGLGTVRVMPLFEFNINGYYQNRIREDKNKDFALKADAENNLSLESGVGFDVKKEIIFTNDNILSLNAGGMYYHEFSKPYHALDASMYGMEGSYRISDYAHLYERDRGVVHVGFDYRWKNLTFYGKYRQYLEHENPLSVNFGIKYKF